MEADLNTTAAPQPADAPTFPSRYKWWVVFMLWFICFFNYADRQTISSVFLKLREEFGFDAVELGLIGSAFMWLYAAGGPLAGYVGDRLRRKDLILGGCLFWSGITVMTGWCGRFWQFFTVRALEGFGEAFYFPASMSMVSDYHGSTRSRAMSFHQSSVYIGTIAGGWLGAWFAEKYGWRVGFYLFGALGMALALVLYSFLREPARGASESLGAGPVKRTAEVPTVAELVRAVFAHPAVPLLMLAFVCANFVATIFLMWTPTFLAEKYGFKLSTAGLSGTVFIHAASACSVPVGGWLADTLSRRFGGGRIMVQVVGLLVGSFFVFLVGSTREVKTLLVAMTVFGACKGLYDSNIFAAMYDFVRPEARASAAGLMNTIGWGGGALGPVAVGFMAKYGQYGTEIENMSQAIAWCGGVYLAGAVLLVGAILVTRRFQAEGQTP